VTVICASGTPSPLASFTVPEICETDCAKTAEQNAKQSSTRTNKIIESRFMILDPPAWANPYYR
jgi:hypothetical protein